MSIHLKDNDETWWTSSPLLQHGDSTSRCLFTDTRKFNTKQMRAAIMSLQNQEAANSILSTS